MQLNPAFRIIKNHVVFPIKDPEKTRLVFPMAKIAPNNGSYLCAVPHTVEVTRFFRNNGHNLPSPVMSDYNWPGRFRPYPHQIATTEFLVANKRAYCLSGMGVMKTAAALWAADFLIRNGDIKKCLIVSPLSTLDQVWAKEIFQVLPHRRCHILHGARDKRMELLNDRSVDFYIINHDGMKIIEDALQKRPDINHIIIDEIAIFRRASTAKNKAVFRIINRQGIDRGAWGLTGTPTPTSPTDCFGQVKLITPENYRYGFKTLQSELMMQVSQYRWVPKLHSASRVNELMQPSIRYALEDCVALPPTIWHDRACEMSVEQKKHYETMKKTSLAEISGKQVTAVNAAVLFGKLLQVSCGCVYSSDGEILEMDFGPRLDVLKEIIDGCNEKVIIFVPFTAALRSIEDKLKRSWSVAVVDGSVSAKQRNTIFKDFQAEKDPHIILAHPGTMAHGLTLTAASTIIWYAPVTSNETFMQANARIVRPSQTKTTNIVMISGSPVEEKIYRTIKERGKLQDLVLELVKGG